MSSGNKLERFLKAQEQQYATALAEIRNGRKKSHWMWYVFPQLRGLGLSETARYYAIQDQAEAAAYLQHPVLGKRLIGISEALLQQPDRNALQVLGSPDDLKLRSSMTLFAALPDTHPVFGQVLDQFYGGKPDDRTVALLRS